MANQLEKVHAWIPCSFNMSWDVTLQKQIKWSITWMFVCLAKQLEKVHTCTPPSDVYLLAKFHQICHFCWNLSFCWIHTPFMVPLPQAHSVKCWPLMKFCKIHPFLTCVHFWKIISQNSITIKTGFRAVIYLFLLTFFCFFVFHLTDLKKRNNSLLWLCTN